MISHPDPLCSLHSGHSAPASSRSLHSSDLPVPRRHHTTRAVPMSAKEDSSFDYNNCIPPSISNHAPVHDSGAPIWYHDPTGPSYMRTAAYRSSACRRSYMYPRMGMYRRRARAASRDHTTFDHMQCSTCTTGICTSAIPRSPVVCILHVTHILLRVAEAEVTPPLLPASQRMQLKGVVIPSQSSSHVSQPPSSSSRAASSRARCGLAWYLQSRRRA